VTRLRYTTVPLFSLCQLPRPALVWSWFRLQDEDGRGWVQVTPRRLQNLLSVKKERLTPRLRELRVQGFLRGYRRVRSGRGWVYEIHLVAGTRVVGSGVSAGAVQMNERELRGRLQLSDSENRQFAVQATTQHLQDSSERRASRQLQETVKSESIRRSGRDERCARKDIPKVLTARTAIEVVRCSPAVTGAGKSTSQGLRDVRLAGMESYPIVENTPLRAVKREASSGNLVCGVFDVSKGAVWLQPSTRIAAASQGLVAAVLGLTREFVNKQLRSVARVQAYHIIRTLRADESPVPQMEGSPFFSAEHEGKNRVLRRLPCLYATGIKTKQLHWHKRRNALKKKAASAGGSHSPKKRGTGTTTLVNIGLDFLPASWAR